MKIKKLIVGIIFVALTSCGYQPIYSNKINSNILIKKIQLEGDKKINRKIILLANIKKNDQKNSYNLTINSKKNTSITAKDKSGNASVYNTTISVELTLKEPDNSDQIFKTKKFEANFSYSNIENKFDLQQYKKNIEENLINNIVEEITIFLNS